MQPGTSGEPTLKVSPLNDRHVALGAKMADFGGWLMPIEYPGGGVLREHAAVREAVGVFDVSHLGKARVSGPGAREYVNSCFTNDLGKIVPGKAQYTLCCDDATGGVVDDLIQYLRGEDEVFLIPNAANTGEVVRRLQASAPAGITVTNEHEQYAVLAVQGPRSDELVAAVGLPTELPYMAFADVRPDAFGGAPVVVCRTGYTGERGVELVVPAEVATTVWDRLLEAGASLGVLPCGLGARDTLRTELGYPLHGHELSLDISPVQARAGWAVGWAKPRFWGRDVLLAEKAAGPARLLRGLHAVERAIPRPGMTVSAGGAAVGTLTSGTFSPTLRVGIGLALLDAGVGEGDEVTVDVRGRPAAMTVVRLPFVPAHTQ